MTLNQLRKLLEQETKKVNELRAESARAAHDQNVSIEEHRQIIMKWEYHRGRQSMAHEMVDALYSKQMQRSSKKVGVR